MQSSYSPGRRAGILAAICAVVKSLHDRSFDPASAAFRIVRGRRRADRGAGDATRRAFRNSNQALVRTPGRSGLGIRAACEVVSSGGSHRANRRPSDCASAPVTQSCSPPKFFCGTKDLIQSLSIRHAGRSSDENGHRH